MKNKSFKDGRKGPPKGGKRPPHKGNKGKRPDFRKGGSGDRKFDGPPKARVNANLWGVHAVREAWLNPARAIRALHITETALAEFADAIEKAEGMELKRPAPNVIDRKVLDNSLRDAVHQGIALEAEPLEEVFVYDLAVLAQKRPRAVLLMLDQVTDPHNVGAIMRSASAFGASGIIMQSRHAPEITGVLAKAACGAVEHIPIAYEVNLGRAMAHLQEQGFRAVGLDERGVETLSDLPAHDKTVLILGAEGKGLRQHMRDDCDVLVRLPTEGPILSLNVSNAAAVALYALTSAK